MQKKRKGNIMYEIAINKAIEYIIDNLHEPLNLKSVATEACMSPFHFHRIFFKLKGETPANFIQRNRIEKAKKLIQSQQKMFFREIACECGFSSQSLLSKTFRKYYGTTLHEYRKTLKSNIK